MKKINIVYQNHNMQSDTLTAIEAADGMYQVVWSRRVQPGFDAVVYFNHYTYNATLHKKVCPDALKILYMYEPVSVDPIQYTTKQWRKFDHVLTWNTYLTSNSNAFHPQLGIYFDLPYSTDPPPYIRRILRKSSGSDDFHIRYGIRVSHDSDTILLSRKKAICQICGDRISLIKEELYSLRRQAALWFYKNGTMQMDVFGVPPMNVPNYRGICKDKLDVLSGYRYALCFENNYHPLWTRGYLTEKILDCMAAGTIPIYYGASNIEELIPTDCFIDYRKHQSFHDLETFLQNLSDEEYLGYVERMRLFLKKYDAPKRHSAYRLYEAVAALCDRDRKKKKRTNYPPDYIQSCSFMASLRYVVTNALLPYHRIIYPVWSFLYLSTRRAPRKSIS